MRYAMPIAVFAALTLAACDKPKEDAAKPMPDTPRKMAAAQTGAGSPALDAQDPCRLLDPKEVEAVLGPLAGPPYRTRDVSDYGEPADEGNACRYEARDLRSITVAVTWSGGGMALRVIGLPGAATPAQVKGQIPKGLLPEGMTLTGEWDEAAVIGCCKILALRGDSLVDLDYAGSRARPEQAVGLLNAALQKLDKPLAIDGRAGNTLAQQRAAMLPRMRPVCELVTRAEAEAIFGALKQVPKGDDKSCLYAVAAPAKFETPEKMTTNILNMMASGTQASEVRLIVKWRGGFRELRGGVAMMGGMQQMMEKSGSLAPPAQSPNNPMDKALARARGASMQPPAQVTGGPWDEAWQTSGGFMAVRKDVLVSIETPSLLSGADLDKRRQIVAKALDKL